MKLPKSWATVTLLSKTLTMILFVSLPFVGFIFGKQYQKKITVPLVYQNSKSDILTIENCVFQDKTAKITGVYSDKEKNFQIELPEEWRGSIENDGSLKMQSPDLLIINEGYGLPVVGAEIRVSEKVSDYIDLNEYKKNKLDYGIKEGWILNLRNLTVDRVKALQYEWAWEGYGTTTNFVKNGKFYSITMYYNYDQKSNKKYLETYTRILSSFKILEE